MNSKNHSSTNQGSTTDTVAIKALRTVTGRVVSNKMNKTIAVEIERLVKHPRYGKFIRRTTKLLAHDEHNDSREGDKGMRLWRTREHHRDRVHAVHAPAGIGDRIRGEHNLNAEAEVACEGRALNHELGFIGENDGSHVGCPGPGSLARVYRSCPWGRDRCSARAAFTYRA